MSPGMSHQNSSPTTQQPSAAVLAAQILAMILQNGTSLATQQPRPHSLAELQVKRRALLRDPFFDERYERAELGPRRHPPSPILFMDVVVLTARLMRVLMRRGNETNSEEYVERMVVRNDCLDHAFFRRARTDCDLPFVDANIDSEYYEGLEEDHEAYDCMHREGEDEDGRGSALCEDVATDEDESDDAG